MKLFFFVAEFCMLNDCRIVSLSKDLFRYFFNFQMRNIRPEVYIDEN